MMIKMKELPEADRPREKLLAKGVQHLTNSELLAILINCGNAYNSVVETAHSLLNCIQHDLHRLGCLSVKEITKLKIKGLGPSKASLIVAALELGVRREAAANNKACISHSRDIAQYLRVQLQFKKQEVFGVVLLNRSNRVNHFEILSEGGITATVADPRIILRKALEYDAVNIILFHNHPGGGLRPSRADREFTGKIKEAASYLDLHLLDHIIVSNEGYYSFADNDIL